MKQGYRPELDGVRALAALAVLLFHAHAPGFSNGRDGVTIFFVLSGYLITTLIVGEVRATGRIDVAAFWARRMRRLYPALTLVVAVTTLAGLLLDRSESASDAGLALSYTMNAAAFAGRRTTPLFHTWTLAAEMQFYVLWPVVLPWMLRAARPRLVLGGLWMAFALFNMAMLPLGERFAYFFPTAAASALVGGAFVALSPGARTSAGWCGAVLVLAALFWPPDVVGFAVRASPALVVGSALLISSLRRSQTLSRALAARPLAGLGLLSYGVYLWHWPIMSLLPDANWLARLAVAGPLSLALAALSYVTIERWFRAPRTASIGSEPIQADLRA